MEPEPELRVGARTWVVLRAAAETESAGGLRSAATSRLAEKIPGAAVAAVSGPEG